MTKEASRSTFDKLAVRKPEPRGMPSSTAAERRSPPRQDRPPPLRVVRKSQLSPARQWLVEAMQKIGFGKLTRLVIVKGEPVIEPPPRRYRYHRLTGPNHERREQVLKDFLLKQQLVKLFVSFDRLENGVISVLQVRDGLPYGMTLEEPSRT